MSNRDYDVIKSSTIDAFFAYLSVEYERLITADWKDKIESGKDILTKHKNKYFADLGAASCDINRDWLTVVKRQLYDIEIVRSNGFVGPYNRYNRYLDIYFDIFQKYGDQSGYIVDVYNTMGHTMDDIINYLTNCKSKIEFIYTRYARLSQLEIDTIIASNTGMINILENMQEKIIQSSNDCNIQIRDDIIPPQASERCCARCGDEQCRRKVIGNSKFCGQHSNNGCDLNTWRLMLEPLKALNKKFNELLLEKYSRYGILNYEYNDIELNNLYIAMVHISIELLQRDNIPITQDNVAIFLTMIYFVNIIIIAYREYRQLLCFRIKQCGRRFNSDEDIGHRQAIIFARNIYKTIELFVGPQYKFTRADDVRIMIYIITDLQLKLQGIERNFQKIFTNSSFINKRAYDITISSYISSIKNSLDNLNF